MCTTNANKSWKMLQTLATQTTREIIPVSGRKQLKRCYVAEKLNKKKGKINLIVRVPQQDGLTCFYPLNTSCISCFISAYVVTFTCCLDSRAHHHLRLLSRLFNTVCKCTFFTTSMFACLALLNMKDLLHAFFLFPKCILPQKLLT